MPALSNKFKVHVSVSRQLKLKIIWLGVVVVLGSALVGLTLSFMQVASLYAEYAHVSDDFSDGVSATDFEMDAGKQLFAATDYVTGTVWQSSCESQRIVISGLGMGDGNETLTNPQTIVFSTAIPVESVLVAQIAGRYNQNNGGPVPDSVVFAVSETDVITVSKPVTSSLFGYSFFTQLLSIDPVVQITATVNGVTDSIATSRGLITYYMEDATGMWSFVGRIVNQYVYRGLVECVIEESLSFPPLQQETSLYVTAVIIDNNDDTRPFNLMASAGGVSQTITETGPSHGDLLNIVEIELVGVPTGTAQALITLRSPHPNGDSLILAGVNVNYQCSQDNDSVAFLPIVMNPLVLDVDINRRPVPGIVGLPMTYTITVTNPTDKIAEELELIHQVPDWVIPNPNATTSSSNPTCEGGNILKCEIGSLHPGNSNTTEIYVVPTQAGTVINEGVVNSTIPGANVGGSGMASTRINACVPGTVEDNNFVNALGPLIYDLNLSYCGKLNDPDDYYFVTLPSSGVLTARFRSTGSDIPFVQLATYDESEHLLAYTKKYKKDLDLETDILAPGKYFVRVYTTDIENYIMYTLTVEFNP